MIVTEDFVFIHLPKTGGSFVSKIIKEIYCPSPFKRKLHSLRNRYRIKLPFVKYKYSQFRRHAMRKYIPIEHRNKQIVTCIRNPLDLYVSQFKFDWWRQNPATWFVRPQRVVKEFGELADMNFENFVRATQKHGSWRADKMKNEAKNYPGRFSSEWIHYFCHDPKRVLFDYAQMETVIEKIKQETSGIRFLKMENLNNELAEFLLEQGFDEEAVSFVRGHQKVYPGSKTRSDSDKFEAYFNSQLRQEVEQWEYPLFRLFYPDSLKSS